VILVFECDNDHLFALVDPEGWDGGLKVTCPVCAAPVRVLDREVRIDPREMGGDIAGPGGPFDQGGVVVDTRHAILVDRLDVARIDDWNNADAYALLVEGRINRSTDRAKVMLTGDLDCLASFVTEIHGVAQRAHKTGEFMARCERRWKEMPHKP
jgi:hypothetical protein